MCCGSHGANVLLPSVQRLGEDVVKERQSLTLTAIEARNPSNTGDVMAKGGDSADRCRCQGMLYPMDADFSEVAAGPNCCRCTNVITGEDMRCNRCRTYCLLEWTPRVMSPAFAQT